MFTLCVDSDSGDFSKEYYLPITDTDVLDELSEFFNTLSYLNYNLSFDDSFLYLKAGKSELEHLLEEQPSILEEHLFAINDLCKILSKGDTDLNQTINDFIGFCDSFTDIFRIIPNHINKLICYYDESDFSSWDEKLEFFVLNVLLKGKLSKSDLDMDIFDYDYIGDLITSNDISLYSADNGRVYNFSTLL